MLLLRTPPIIMVALLFGVAGLVLSGAPRQPVVYGQGDANEIFPFESLSDWASYAHQLSVVTVVGEEELPPPEPPESHGGYVGRSVVLRIDETIWTAPGEEPVTGEIDSVVWGWMLNGSALRPVNFGSGPRLEVGNRYLIALVPLEDDDWGQVTGSSVLPLEGDRVPEDFRTVHPVASQLVGLTTPEIVELLEAAPPDPVADSLRHLDPVERVRTALEFRRDAIESGEPWSLPEVPTADPPSTVVQPDKPEHDRFEQPYATGGFDPYSAPVIFWVGPHISLDQMVRESDAIVIGTVKELLREATEGSYGSDGTLQSPREAGVMDQGGELIPRPGVPSSYFEVEIERILLGDGRLEESGTFELRLYGTASDPNGHPWPMPEAGQRLLFALGVNPDFQSYGAGPWWQIDIEGAQPLYRDWAGTPVALADDMDPGAFLAELEAAVSAID